jgi:trigger factor
MAQSDIKSHRGLESVHYKNIRTQMAQYGQTNPTDEEVQGCTRFVKPRRSEKIIRSSGSGEIVRIV